MVMNMPTSMLVVIVLVLILLAIGVVAIMSASGLSIPIFDQIDELLKSLTVPGVAK